MRSTVLALTALALACTGSAWAQRPGAQPPTRPQPPPRPPPSPHRVITEGQLGDMIVRLADADHDHRISPAEFAHFFGEETSSSPDLYFRRLDEDRSGYLEGQEAVHFVNNAIRTIASDCDQNQDHLFRGAEIDCINEEWFDTN